MGATEVAGVHGVDDKPEPEEATEDTAGCCAVCMGKG